MSALQAPAVEPRDNRAAMLAAVQTGELSTKLGRAQLRKIDKDITRLIENGEALAATLKEFTGPDTADALAKQFAFGIQSGTGYYRQARDIARAALKEKAQRRGERA